MERTDGRNPGLLLFVSIVAFTDTCFLAVLTPLLPTLSHELGLSKLAAGIAVAAFPAGMLVATIPAGRLAAQVGTRRCAVTGLTVVAVASLGFANASSGFALCLFRFVHGTGSAAAWAGALGMLMESTPLERRGRSISRVFQVSFVGMMLGPLIGAAAEATDRRLVFTVVAVVVGLVAAWGGPRLPRPKVPTVPSVRDMLTSPDSALGLTVLVVIGAIEGAVASLGALLLSGLGASALAIAATFSASYAVQIAVLPFIGRWTDRSGPIPPTIGSLAVVVPALIVLPLTGSILVAGVAIVAIWSGCLCTWGPAVVLLTRSADQNRTNMAMAMAMMNGAWALGLAGGAAVFAALANASTNFIAFLAADLVCLGTIALIRACGGRQVEAPPHPVET